jgi:hypothetical protein
MAAEQVNQRDTGATAGTPMGLEPSSIDVKDASEQRNSSGKKRTCHGRSNEQPFRSTRRRQGMEAVRTGFRTPETLAVGYWFLTRLVIAMFSDSTLKESIDGSFMFF